MRGYIKQKSDFPRPQCFWEEVVDVPFMVLCCGEQNNRWQRRRLRRALRKMAEQGICRAIIPPDMIPLCREMGIQPIEERPLRLALMEPLLDSFCAQNGLDIHRSTVRLCGHRVDRALQQAAVLLAGRARYIELQIDIGQQELSDWLRREYGISTGCGGHGAILRICCNDAQAENIPTLWLGQNCEKQQRISYRLSQSWHGRIEADPQLLSVLFAEGKLPLEAISIKSVETYA